MKRSIFTIIATIGLALPAAASATAFAESFERELDRNHTQISTEVRSGQDSFQQYVNRAINGSDTIFASFDRDLNRTPAQDGYTTGLETDTFQKQFNLALRIESNPVMLSFNRDLYRTATPTAPTIRSTDSVQQWINVALTGKNNNPLIASFERVMGVEIAAGTNHQALLFGADSYGADWNAFWWNSELFTAFA